MKLNYFQLEAHLAKQLASIYIVSGDELLLKQDAIQLLRRVAKQSGFTERVRLSPEAGFDWEQLYAFLYSASLLAEKRLIELDFRNSTPNKIASQILQEYGEKPTTENLLLIDIGKTDDKITKSAWYKSLTKKGVLVNIWPLNREQLPQWIMQRAKKYKITIQQDAVNLLTDYVEGNLAAAAQIVEKIYLLNSTKPVDAEVLKILLTDESRFSIFDFLEHWVSGNTERALHILEALKQAGTEPVLILWGITRELRLLAEFAQQINQGMPLGQLLQKHRIFFRRETAIKNFLKTFSAKDCWLFLSQAAELDKIIKGAVTRNIWEALHLFCLKTRPKNQ